MLFERYSSEIRSVVLDGPISIEEFVAVARGHARVDFSPAYLQRVAGCRAALEDKLNSGVSIYGVNTGFGDNVRYRIDEADMIKLQENILHSHGCGFGTPMTEEFVRALMIFMLNNMGKGYSAVRVEVVQIIREFLNKDVYPYVPSEGGNSSLTNLPFLAITFLGEGRIYDKDGTVKPALEVLKKKGIEPIPIKPREGLALLNSSPSICAFTLALYDLTLTLRHADLCAALVCEALRTTDKAYHPVLMELKGRRETMEVAEYLRKIFADSKILEASRNGKVQDSVSARMIPHMHGTLKRLTRQSYEVVVEELRAVNDNPVFLPDGSALMGGNWDTAGIAIYADALTIGIVNMAKLFEVHMERMTNPNLSGLPAFLVKKPGLNNGFMIVQYVTANLLGEITFLANSSSSFMRTVSAGQEGPGYNDVCAACKLYDAVHKLGSLVTMTMMTALQALDFREQDMSSLTQALYDEVRKTVTFMEEDDMMYERIEAMEKVIHSNRLLQIAQSRLGEFTL